MLLKILFVCYFTLANIDFAKILATQNQVLARCFFLKTHKWSVHGADYVEEPSAAYICCSFHVAGFALAGVCGKTWLARELTNTSQPA